MEVGAADVKDFPRVADFLVDFFYLDGGQLGGWDRRRISGAQAADMRKRYGGGGAFGLEGRVLCAEEEGEGSRDVGRLVGTIAVGEFVFLDGEIALGAGPEAEGAELRVVIANLAVDRERRRQGVGKKLVAEAEAAAKEWSYDYVWLLVEKNNTRAQRLYRKLGYREQGLDEGRRTLKVIQGRMQELPVDSLYMRKSLKPLIGSLENFLGL